MIIAALASCSTYSTFGDGRLVPKDRVQLGLQGGVLIGSDAPTSRAVYAGDFAARWGATSFLDVGARLGTSGFYAEARAGFVPFRTGFLMFSLMGGVIGGPEQDISFVPHPAGTASVLLSVQPLRWLRPFLAALVFGSVQSNNGGKPSVYPGGAAGIAFVVHERVSIVPELSFIVVPSGFDVLVSYNGTLAVVFTVGG